MIYPLLSLLIPSLLTLTLTLTLTTQEDVQGIIAEGLQCLCSTGYYGHICQYKDYNHSSFANGLYPNFSQPHVSWKVDESIGWLDFFAATFMITFGIVIGVKLCL